MTAAGRVQVSSVGILDALHGDASRNGDPPALQREDLSVRSAPFAAPASRSCSRVASKPALHGDASCRQGPPERRRDDLFLRFSLAVSSFDVCR